ncbi:hypothetical protein N7534_011997 [Penicillium rubens]|nr:hypothetical protein N7534_011997 [Penicillium rubens]
MKPPPSHSLLFVLLIAGTVATSTTRYTVPIPESMDVLETRRELIEMAEQYPLCTVDARNGGWYILNYDGTVLAVATDSVCEELDASIEEAMRLYGLFREPDNQIRRKEEAQTNALLRWKYPQLKSSPVAECMGYFNN